MALRNELESLWTAYIDAKADGEWSKLEVLGLTAALCGVVQTSIEHFVGDDEEWAMLVDDVEYFVDDYIVPWDIPGVGPFFEGLLDRQMVAMVEPLMAKLRIT